MRRGACALFCIGFAFLAGMGCAGKAEKTGGDYPAYFQEILDEREKTGEEAKSDDGTGKSYCISSDIEEENVYVCEIEKLYLSETKELENLSFDIRDYLEKAGFKQGFIHAVFYDEESDTAYLVICSTMTSYTMLVEFKPESPEDFTVSEYPGTDGWFGECCCFGDTIYLHGGAGSAPFAINRKTKEIYHCEAELQKAEELVKEWRASGEEKLSVCWFFAEDQVQDITIYKGYVQEAMDMEIMKTVYLAYRGRELADAMMIDEKTGEITRK